MNILLKEMRVKMKDNIILALKGAIIGIANVIPGVSGGTLAITLGIYEQLIEAISHFFKNFRKNIKFIVPIGIGAAISILVLSKVINFSLDNYPVPTFLFFIGLIIGGIPLLYKKVKGEKKSFSNLIIFLITFGIVVVMAIFQGHSNVVDFSRAGVLIYPVLFLVGAIAAATMVIPGVSGSFVLMLLGFYKPIINTISNLTKFDNILSNLLILIPFGIGVLVGIVLIAKLIEYLLKKFEIKTYYGILGFVFASILTLLKPLFGTGSSVLEVIIGVVLLIVGSIIAYKLGDE